MIRLKFPLCLFILFLFLLFFSFLRQTPAFAKDVYSEDFDPRKPKELMFKGNLFFGADGAWSGSLENGRYIMENSDDPSAIRYYYIFPDTGQRLNKGTEVSVDVDGKFAAGIYNSGAGLVYDVDPETRFYFAFVIMNQNDFGIYRKDENGFQMKMGGTHSAIRKEKSNRLTIATTKQGIAFKINNQEIGSLGNEPGATNGVGILALGAGRFSFDNFLLAAGGNEAVQSSKPLPFELTFGTPNRRKELFSKNYFST